jgi:hypothetical protein
MRFVPVNFSEIDPTIIEPYHREPLELSPFAPTILPVQASPFTYLFVDSHRLDVDDRADNLEVHAAATSTRQDHRAECP